MTHHIMVVYLLCVASHTVKMIIILNFKEDLNLNLYIRQGKDLDYRVAIIIWWQSILIKMITIIYSMY